MNRTRSIFHVLLHDETKDKKWMREILAVLALMATIMFIIPAPYTTFSIHSLENLLKGTIAVTLYLSFLSAISKVKDRKYKMLLSLPIDKKTFIFLYSLVVYIKNHMLRVMPIILSVLAVSGYYGKLTFLQCALAVIVFAAAGFFTSLCGITAIIFVYDHNFIRFKPRRSLMKFSWLRREFVRFSSDKVILINHLGYSVFILFFIVNALTTFRVEGGFLLFVLSLLSTCSTPGVLFSYEKPYRNLLQSLPVSIKKLYWGKYVFSITITVPLYVAAYTIVYIYDPLTYTIDLLVLLLCSLMLITFIKLYYDYKRPNYNWSHSRQMFEHPRKYKLWGMSMAVSVTLMLYSYVTILGILAVQLLVTWFFLYLIKKGDTVNES